MRKLLLALSCSLLFLLSIAQEKEAAMKEFNRYAGQYVKYRNEGKSDSVFYIARQSLKFAQIAKNDSLLSRAYTILGNAFLIASDFPSALDYYFIALRLAEQRGDAIRAGTIAGNISYTYYQVGSYTSGVEYGLRAIRDVLSAPLQPDAPPSKLNSYYSNLTNAYDNAGGNYLGLNKSDSALYCFQLGYAAILKSKDEGDVFYKVTLLIDLARTYEQLNEKKMAESHFMQAFEILDSVQMRPMLAYSAKNYGAFLLRNNRYNDVIKFGRKGIDAAVQSTDRISVIELAGLLQNAYEATARRDSAFYFAKMVNTYRDSVFSTQKMLAMQNTVLKQQLNERNSQLEREKQAEERRNNLQYAAIALAIVVLLILFLLLSHSVIANQRLIKFLGILALLIVFEFLNLFLHPHIGNLTHHSPIMMLGIMVCLAALLIPLHHKLEHWIIHRLVEKNNRIRLMAAHKTIQQLETKQEHHN